MIIPRIAAAILATLLLSGAADAQSAADLLQKGIHAQETSGDLDGAIQIFRQVVAAPNTNKQLAAQAQYQLVLCVMQKGDRPGAVRELQFLEKTFADQPDVIARARKLLPGSSAVLPSPWLDGELEQLNIKRNGVSTGETLTYSADPWSHTVAESQRSRPYDPTYASSIYLRWELTTKNSRRSIQSRVDRDTLRPLDKSPFLESDDVLGDPTVAPFAGPATDSAVSVFAMRHLPLTVGYKTSFPYSPSPSLPSRLVDLSVTGIEAIQVPYGKFNCYKISLAELGQTFWIAVDEKRSLVKFQSGDVEAELVKTWGPANPLDSALAFVTAAGWEVGSTTVGPGPSATAEIMTKSSLQGFRASVTIRRVYTPATEIARALEQSVTRAVRQTSYSAGGYNPVKSIRPGSVQNRIVNGQQAVIFLIDNTSEKGHDGVITKESTTTYCAVIQAEDSVIEFRGNVNSDRDLAVFRWQFDPILAAPKIP